MSDSIAFQFVVNFIWEVYSMDSQLAMRAQQSATQAMLAHQRQQDAGGGEGATAEGIFSMTLPGIMSALPFLNISVDVFSVVSQGLSKFDQLMPKSAAGLQFGHGTNFSFRRMGNSKGWLGIG